MTAADDAESKSGH